MRTLVLSLMLLCGVAQSQTIIVKKIFQYPNVANPPTSYLLVMDSGNGSLFNISLDQLFSLIGTNQTSLNVTNLDATYITNLTLYSTNIYVQFITNQTFVTTNVVVEQPGGLTNLNLTPKSVMWSDANDAEASIPNASGVLTNNGSGGIGFSQSLSLSEIDAINFFPTNLFTGLTNVAVLGTDGNGILTIGSSTVTNLTITNLYAETITNNTFVNTNTVIITGKASVNTLIVTNVAVYGNLTNTLATPSTVAVWDATRLLTNAPNAHGVFTNTASGPSSFGLLQATEIAPGIAPFLNAINITNSPYIMGTNNGGGNALVSGSPGTSATMYLTNITADTTLAAATFWNAGGSVIPLYCSCSGGANKILKFPANFQGAGDLYGIDLNGTGVTITNGEASWFEIRCIYGVKTNVFRSNTK